MSKLLSHSRIHIELSSKCTLKCPRCPRTELKPEALNKELSLLEFQRGFSNLLSGVNELTFCGDIGDPIYAKDFLRIIEYIKLSKFDTRLIIVTNGSYKTDEWWQELGKYLQPTDTVIFSVDGWDQTSNEQYRVNSDFESIISGARALRQATQAEMVWSAIYFKFNEDKMSQIRALATDIGFDTFWQVKSSKFDGEYLINGVDVLKPIVHFAKTAQYEVSKERLSSRPFPVMFHNTRQQHPWARCANYEKEMFINVEGYVFPCPWFNSGYLENDFFEKYKDKLSIKTRTLTEILDDPLWNEMYTRFETMPLEICKMKCRDAR